MFEGKLAGSKLLNLQRERARKFNYRLDRRERKRENGKTALLKKKKEFNGILHPRACCIGRAKSQPIRIVSALLPSTKPRIIRATRERERDHPGMILKKKAL